MIIIPLMPWMMNPATPVKVRSSSSIAALSTTPPSSTQMPSPATANTITIAWMTTSTAMMMARIRYALIMCDPPWSDDSANRMTLSRRNVAHFDPGRMIICGHQDWRPTTSSSTGPSWLTSCACDCGRPPDLLEPAAEPGRGGLVVEVQDDLDLVLVVGPAQHPVGPDAVLLAEPLELVEDGLPAVVVVDLVADQQ